MSRRAAHFCSHVNCFLQKMWGNLKNGTSEGQHLCGSEIPRVYYIGLEEGSIIAAMVLNHQYNEGYKKFNWQTKASEHEITVIHALGVLPEYSGKGYAKEMVKKRFKQLRTIARK